MAGFGQTLRVNLANAVLRNTAYTAVTTVYVSLHTGDPGVDGASASGNEVSTSGTAYARQSVTFSAPTAASPNSVTTSNAAVTYTTATASWGTITYFGLWSSSTLQTAAAFIGANTLTAPQAVASGNTASFASGAITHTFTG